jgi:hypothetical protein
MLMSNTNVSAAYLAGISQDDAGYLFWRGTMLTHVRVPTSQEERDAHRATCEQMHLVCTWLEEEGFQVNFQTYRAALARVSSIASQARMSCAAAA